MIRVNPVNLVVRHQTHLDERSVIETERQRLECQPLVFGGRFVRLLGRNDGYQVLRADTPFVRAVDTRFVGDDMSYLQRRRVIVCTHVLRSFVTAEEMAYAVTCAVTESDAGFPHVLLCQGIELVTACASRETGTSQSDMTFEHVGVVPFGLLRFASAEPHSTGDVGCAVQVLTA